MADAPAPSSPARQALVHRPSTASSGWSPVGSPTSASTPTTAGPEDEVSMPAATPAPAAVPVPVAVRPSTSEVAGADTAAAIAAAAGEPLDKPDGPGVFRRVGKWAGKLVSKNKSGDGDDDEDGGVGGAEWAGEQRQDHGGAGDNTGRRRRRRSGRGEEEERRFEAAEGGDGARVGVSVVGESEGTARRSSARAAADADATAAEEGEDFSLLFPGAGAVPGGQDGGGGGGADEMSRFVPMPMPMPSAGGDRGSGGVDGFGNGGAVVVFQLLMQRWRLRPWVVVPRTLVATKEQVRAAPVCCWG